MKKIIPLFVLAFILSTSVFAEDLTPLSSLIKQGLQAQMGELTGAGTKFSLHNLEGLILPEGVLLKSDCLRIVVKNSTDPKVSDIVRVQLKNEDIEASDFVGFVIK